jgi:hypothetical protein
MATSKSPKPVKEPKTQHPELKVYAPTPGVKEYITPLTETYQDLVNQGKLVVVYPMWKHDTKTVQDLSGGPYQLMGDQWVEVNGQKVVPIKSGVPEYGQIIKIGDVWYGCPPPLASFDLNTGAGKLFMYTGENPDGKWMAAGDLKNLKTSLDPAKTYGSFLSPFLSPQMYDSYGPFGQPLPEIKLPIVMDSLAMLASEEAELDAKKFEAKKELYEKAKKKLKDKMDAATAEKAAKDLEAMIFSTGGTTLPTDFSKSFVEELKSKKSFFQLWKEEGEKANAQAKAKLLEEPVLDITLFVEFSQQELLAHAPSEQAGWKYIKDKLIKAGIPAGLEGEENIWAFKNKHGYQAANGVGVTHGTLTRTLNLAMDTIEYSWTPK